MVLVLFRTVANVLVSVVVALSSAYFNSNARADDTSLVFTRKRKVVEPEDESRRRRLLPPSFPPLLLPSFSFSGISSISDGSTPSSNANDSINACLKAASVSLPSIPFNVT